MDGCGYRVVILDPHSRMVIDWAFADHMRSDLVEARAAIHECFEVSHNRKRQDSSLGYPTPAEVDDLAG